MVILLSAERFSLIDEIRNFATPSEGVESEEKINSWANEKSGIHIHRPAGNYGPPTTLLQLAFARVESSSKEPK